MGLDTILSLLALEALDFGSWLLALALWLLVLALGSDSSSLALVRALASDSGSWL